MLIAKREQSWRFVACVLVEIIQSLNFDQPQQLLIRPQTPEQHF